MTLFNEKRLPADNDNSNNSWIFLCLIKFQNTLFTLISPVLYVMNIMIKMTLGMLKLLK